MKKSTFNILFYVKRNALKANGKMPLMGRITVNGQAVQFGAKVEVNPKIWDTKSGKAVGKTQEVIEINGILESIKATMTRIYRDLQERETTVTPERIKNIFFGVKVKQQMLLELFKRHDEDVEKLVGISKSKATLQKYEVTRKHLTNFIKEKYNRSDVGLKEIDYLFITDLEVYLQATAGCSHNTTAKFMYFLKRIVIIAKIIRLKCIIYIMHGTRTLSWNNCMNIFLKSHKTQTLPVMLLITESVIRYNIHVVCIRYIY